MRPLEILLVFLTFLNALAVWATKGQRKLLMSLCALALLVLMIHAGVEGVHWQMAPAYFAVLLVTGSLAVDRALLRRLLAGGVFLLLMASCTFSAFLPMFQLPAPTGPYSIGTEIVPLINDHPRDASSADSDGKRALMVQVWYPAAPSRAPRAPYRIFAETTPLSSYQAVLWTHVRWNAPFADAGPMPVLLLNPAWNGRRTYYMYLVEELVSHGYIVVGVDHTGNSGPTAFPDGSVSQPSDDPKLDFGIHSYEELNVYGAQQQEIQVDDDRFVLNQLEHWSQDSTSSYYRRFDMNRVGALGHSFGGSVSAQDSLEDKRFKAALDMDGSYWGQVQREGVAIPLMMIEEDIAQYTPEELRQNHAVAVDHLFDVSDDAAIHRSNGYRILLHGSTHSSFTDRSLFSPWKHYSGEGSVPALREYSIIRSYVLAFFNKTLRGIDSPLLNPTDRTFPEVTLEVRHRP